MMARDTMVVLVFAATLSACGGSDDNAGEEDHSPVNTDPNTIGQFGEVFDWPIVSMHMALLPDGRVMSFGTSSNGSQGAELHYSVWDPSQGTGAASMLLLPNTTSTDISCAGQTLVPATGELLIVGGDRTIDGQRNYANSDVNLFDASTNQLRRQVQSMAFQRWYATAVTTGDGQQIVLGGLLDRRFDPPSIIPAVTPEIYRPGAGWKTLGGATSEEAFATSNEGWYYPRAWLAPDGSIFMLAHGGAMYSIDYADTGHLERLAGDAGRSPNSLPAVMYEPGKILSLRDKRTSVIVDIRDPTPSISRSGRLSQDRRYASATLLADGRVWVNGGSSTGNDLAGAAYHSEIWDPATGRWTSLASAKMARLYHSASLLLPDATVITGGGGSPGPQTNLNAEIYYPPYLFLPGQPATLAPRPLITAAPTVVSRGQHFNVTMADAAKLSRVTLIRAGAATHAFNNDQRFIDMSFSQAGATVGLRTPNQPSNVPPGFYLLFAFDGHGVPSVARMIRLVD